MEEIKAMIRDLMDKIDQRKEDKILSVKQSMALMSISRDTFDKMVKTGELKAYRIGRKVYCKQSDIYELLERNPIAA